MFINLRISTKLLLTILPLIFIAIGISAYLNNKYQEAQMLDQARNSALTYATIIRESLVHQMQTYERIDDAFLERLNSLREINDLHIHFRAKDLNLREILSSGERLERLRLREQSLRPLTPEELAVFTTGEPMWQRDGTRFKAVIPFTAVAKCRQCHDVPEGRVLGAADMTISLDRIAGAIRDNWIRSIWIIYGAISIALILSVLAFRALVESRLKSLLVATRAIGAGNLDFEGAKKVVAQDELGELAESFETMRQQLRKAEEEKLHSERLAMVGKMASSIVHDFRTPMGTINLAVEALQQGNNVSQERMREWYMMIHTSVRRMVVMAQELLDFSRGETRIDRQQTDIDGFVTALAQSVRPGLGQAKVQLEVRQEFHGQASIDAERLHRALVNIINNSQDAMPQGGTLTLTAEKRNAAVRFEIRDTGVGIPPEIRDTMFDAFVTAGKKKGTGLGLAITKRIVDQHGGSIQVESEPGKGTTFRIDLPLR